MLNRRPLVDVMGRIALGSVAGLAATFALAPAAVAATDVAPDHEPARGPERPAATGQPTSTTQQAPVSALAADFGMQKYRIGIQIADGSWVPAGTTTTGSTFTITETGPNVFVDDEPAASHTFTCTATEKPDPDEEMPASTMVCRDAPVTPFRASSAAAAAASAAAVSAGVTIDPSEDWAPDSQMFLAHAGSTVTIKQVTAGTNLLKTPAVATLAPCEGTEDIFGDGDQVYCSGNYLNTRLSNVIFANVGLPPVATNDVRATQPNTPVSIDILTNDDTVNGAPLTAVTVIRAPGNGTATVVGAVGQASVSAAATGPVITYTPKTGFSGQDTFDYTITTPNGSATATVTITVPAVPAAPIDQPKSDNPDSDRPESDDPESDDPATDAGAEEGALPNVGGVDARLVGLGAALVGGGGFLIAAARRTRDQHDLGA